MNVPERRHAEWENIQFFYELFSDLMNGISTDDLYEEFTDYQILHEDDITDEAWREFKVSGCLKKDVDHEDNQYNYRVDTFWWHISKLLIAGTLVKCFKLLPKLVELVLVISHSNADSEGLFSIVRKNKTVERSTMKLDGTLSSILSMKSMYLESEMPCFQSKPTK